jgi:hypothetical protein
MLPKRFGDFKLITKGGNSKDSEKIIKNFVFENFDFFNYFPRRPYWINMKVFLVLSI